MAFANPLALLLLLALPFLIWVGWPARGATARREWTALILRCLLALALVLALAGIQIVRRADELAVAYLVDVSDSVSPAEQQVALDWVTEAIQALKPNDRAAVILFGAEALVERPLSAVRELAPVTTSPLTLQTDIGAAVRLGLAVMPAGAARRLVILSDGVETMGDASQAAQLAAAAGVTLDVVPLGAAVEETEALLTDVTAPSHVMPGDQFELIVSAASSQATTATLRVLADGRVLYENQVALARGESRFAIPLTAGEQGFARYRVQLIPAEDHYYQNNALAAFTQVMGPPRVLLVTAPAETDDEGQPLPDESAQLSRALLAAGMQVDRIDATQLTMDPAELSEYASIVLVNVNAKYLNPRKMTALQQSVRDLGGGLVVIGGPNSYAPGGYYQTPLEEALPVEMQIRDQERRVNLTMYFVVDKSGSMLDTSVGGIPKVELAKEAVIRSLGLLGPLDRAGVVTFDDSAAWVVPPQEVADPDSMGSQVGSIRAGGGTDIYAGLEAVAAMLPDDPATLKHIVLLTDGGAAEAGNPEITEQMRDEYGATLSVVAIGQGFAAWVEGLAEIGGGRFHFAYDPDTIPEIFTQETSLATRAYIMEEEFWPTLARSHPIVAGITSAPPLYGYVATSPKPAAQTILLTAQEDPLLAAWQYGLGKSVAWTSDATGRWATEWVTWEGYARFWEQAVRWTITQDRGATVETAIQTDPAGSGVALVTVDALAPNGSFMNGLDLDGRVLAPDGTTLVLPLHAIAPGRYQGEFQPTQEGAYLVRVDGASEEGAVAQTAGWVLGYSPEYLITSPDHDALNTLAQTTGGQVLMEPWESLAHNLPAESIRRPIWHWLAILALVLLPLDVAVRRLALRRQDWLKLWQRVQSWLPFHRPKREQPAARSERVGRLFEAKQRAERPTTADEGTPPIILPPKPAARPLPAPASKPTPDQPADSSLATRLLNSKRKRDTEE